MSKKASKWPAWALILALIGVVGGGVLFIGAVAGWFDQGSKLDPEYYIANTSLELSDGDFIELLTKERYQELVNQKKSFVVFIDQTDCSNADRMRGYITDYAREAGIKVYRMMFQEMRESSLHDQVKYYPSVVVTDKGKVVRWLDASSDEDVEEYNDYEAFKRWMKNEK